MNLNFFFYFFLFLEDVTSFLSTSSMARDFPWANRWWCRSAKRFMLCLLSEGSLLWSQKPSVIFWSCPTQFKAKCNVSNTNRNSDTHSTCRCVWICWWRLTSRAVDNVIIDFTSPPFCYVTFHVKVMLRCLRFFLKIFSIHNFETQHVEQL